MLAVQEDTKSAELGLVEQAHVVILTSPKPVFIESSRLSKEERVAATSTSGSDSSVSHTHR